MKTILAFLLSCLLFSTLSATIIPSVVERFKSDNYTARQHARVELMAAFAESTADSFDTAERQALENATVEKLSDERIPLDGRLYLMRMLELYGSDQSVTTMKSLTRSTDPIVSDAAERVLRMIKGGAIANATTPVSYMDASVERAETYRSILGSDKGQALEVALHLLEDTDALARIRILTTAAQCKVEEIRAPVLEAWLKGSITEQMIAVAAIAELELSTYEDTVLCILPESIGQMRSEVVYCLGVIGSNASYAALLELYEQDSKNAEVQAAVARVRAPSADAQTLKDAQNGGSSDARIAAVRVLGLRNPTGATDLLNEQLKSDLNADYLKSVYQTLDRIGDINSVELLLQPRLLLGTSGRDTQRSLKRLSRSLGIADYLWTNVYTPSMARNDTAEYRAAILEILDAVACEGSVAYLQEILENPYSPDYATAYHILQRWPIEKDLFTADLWIQIYSAATATDGHRKKAEKAFKKMLEPMHPDYYKPQIDLLLKIANSDLPVALKRSIFEVYPDAGKHFHTWYHPQAKRFLKPALGNPDVGDLAQKMISQL